MQSVIQNKINSLRNDNIQNFYTNYFMNDIEKDVEIFENNDAILFINPEKDFYKLFFAYSDINSFMELLHKLPNKKIYLEIISKTEPQDDFINAIKPYFEYKTTYQKLYKKLEVSENKVFPKCKTDIDLIFDKGRLICTCCRQKSFDSV